MCADFCVLCVACRVLFFGVRGSLVFVLVVRSLSFWVVGCCCLLIVVCCCCYVCVVVVAFCGL